MVEYDEEGDEFDEEGNLTNEDRPYEEFSFEELVDPEEWAVEYAIQRTRTAAILQDIEPDRITLVS